MSIQKRARDIYTIKNNAGEGYGPDADSVDEVVSDLVNNYEGEVLSRRGGVMIAARLGTEAEDGEAFDGVPIFRWDCDIEVARAFSMQFAPTVDWSAAWDRDGFVEAPLVGVNLEDGSAEQLVRQINSMAAS